MNPFEKQPTSYIEVEGVRFYGDPEGVATEEDVRDIQLTPDGEMHLLRHLSGLSEDARERILSMKLSPAGGAVPDQSYIDGQLKTGGAKFHPEQTNLDDPQKIAAIVKKLLQSKETSEMPQWVRKGNQKRIIFRTELTPELKEELGLIPGKPLGLGNLVEITDETRSAVFKKPRGQNEKNDLDERNFIKMEHGPTTDGLVAVVAKFDNRESPQIVSAHPGIVAPPLPNKKFQSEEEFQYNRTFWSRHAFVEE